MTIAAERLAVIAAVTLPVTAVSSILGMNVIVNEATQPIALAIALIVMATISVTLLIWAKRKGWRQPPSLPSGGSCGQSQSRRLNRSALDRAAELHPEEIWAEPVRRLQPYRTASPQGFARVHIAPDSSADVPDGGAWQQKYGLRLPFQGNLDVDRRGGQ